MTMELNALIGMTPDREQKCELSTCNLGFQGIPPDEEDKGGIEAAEDVGEPKDPHSCFRLIALWGNFFTALFAVQGGAVKQPFIMARPVRF